MSNRVFSPSGSTTAFHTSSHHQEREDRIRDFQKINAYHVSLLPYLLDRLKQIPDGDGTMLDSSLVVYGSAMGNSNMHNHKRCPLLVAGHAGGAAEGRPARQGRRRHADGQRDAVAAARARRRRGRASATAPVRSISTGAVEPTVVGVAHAGDAMARQSMTAARRDCRRGTGWPSACGAMAAGGARRPPVADAAMRHDTAAVRDAAASGRRRQRGAGRRHDRAALGRHARRRRNWPRCCSTPAPTCGRRAGSDATRRSTSPARAGAAAVVAALRGQRAPTRPRRRAPGPRR